MNWLDPWLWLVPVGGLALLVLGWWFFTLVPTIRSERARELFRLQKERLADQFLLAARQTGTPRGLRWSQLDFTGECVLAQQKQSRQIHALVPIEVRFEPTPEGDMQENPNATVPRSGCAVFVFDGGTWHTHGKALFNIDPMEALERFSSGYEPMSA